MSYENSCRGQRGFHIAARGFAHLADHVGVLGGVDDVGGRFRLRVAPASLAAEHDSEVGPGLGTFTSTFTSAN
jgi:hypothetical protein